MDQRPALRIRRGCVNKLPPKRVNTVPSTFDHCSPGYVLTLPCKLAPIGSFLVLASEICHT